VRARWHTKHVVEFFESTLFGLGQPEEATMVNIWSQEGFNALLHHKEGQQVHRSIEAEDTL
jgi:hypothetical protein